MRMGDFYNGIGNQTGAVEAFIKLHMILFHRNNFIMRDASSNLKRENIQRGEYYSRTRRDEESALFRSEGNLDEINDKR